MGDRAILATGTQGPITGMMGDIRGTRGNRGQKGKQGGIEGQEGAREDTQGQDRAMGNDSE